MKINKTVILFLTILMIFNNSCIEEFTPDINKYDYNLVVEGQITNLSGPYTVKLSQTSPLDSVILKPVKKAQVVIEDDSGNTITLTESKDGLYSTLNSDFKGTVGRKYRLKINYNNNSYSSNFITLKEPVEIQDIYTEVEKRDINVYPYESYGYEFFIDSEDITADTSYLYWEMTETYKFNSEFPIDFIYISDSIMPYPNPMEFYTCWKTNLVPEIVIHKHIKQTSNNIKKLPLYYVDNLSRKLTIRYSLLVKQLNIDAETYLFLNRIANQDNNNQSLYTTQPYQIKGNMYNINDENEQVLGSFIVGGASEKRIFVDRPIGTIFHYRHCSPDYEGVSHLNTFQPPVYLSSEDLGLATANAICFDCRLRGGSTKKPDFWTD